MTSPTYILGTGFSKAINDCLPTLQGLSSHVSRVLKDRGLPVDLTPFNDNIEQWLSFVAVDQPWLNVAENYRNRALFYDAADVIYEYVVAQERLARSTHMPSWLMRLASMWSQQEATIITFNYDLFVERALTEYAASRDMSESPFWTYMYPIPLMVGAARSGFGIFAPEPPSGPFPLSSSCMGR